MLALRATALGYAGHGFLSDLLLVESELEKLYREVGPPTSSVNYRTHARLKRRVRVRKERNPPRHLDSPVLDFWARGCRSEFSLLLCNADRAHVARTPLTAR